MDRADYIQRIKQARTNGEVAMAGIASHYIITHRGEDFTSVLRELLRSLQSTWPRSTAFTLAIQILAPPNVRGISGTRAREIAQKLWETRDPTDMSITAISQMFFGISRFLESGIPRDAQAGLSAMISIAVDDSDTPEVSFENFLNTLER